MAEMRPMAGLVGGQPRSMIVPTYRVDDIRASVARVHAAGGTASEPAFEGYGTRAECADDQGTRFMLVQF
jgi:predicted enzyme related to lactoylglutathione lyase